MLKSAASTPEAVDALFQPLAEARGLVVAVSGGPDSVALVLLIAEWARRRPEAPPVSVATVDHGLRPEAAREAAEVGELCRRLGVSHAILAWTGEKPATRLQERAREARYALLGDYTRKIGADTIVTAHHLDDQAETVLIRLLRGSGIAGLAGMAPLAQRDDGLKIARPLLGVTKLELIAVCDAAGVAYVRDPSNDDDRFARTRVRQLIAAEGLDTPALARLARRAAQVEAALAAVADAAEKRLRLVETGACEAAALFAEPTEIAQRLIAAAIAAQGGGDIRRIGLEKIEALTAALSAAHRAGDAFSANVAGARARLGRDGRLRIGPEPPRAHTKANS